MAATEKLPRLGALGHKIADSFVGLPALVTGGTSGIGAAIATALQEAGTTVWRQGLSDGDLQFDLSIPGSGAALAEAALQRGPIDIIVLSASIQSRSAWQAVEPAAMELQLRTNLIEPFDLVRRLLPAMIQREWGGSSQAAAFNSSAPTRRCFPTSHRSRRNSP